MKIDNSFTVPMPPAEAWSLLLNVPTIAPCLPGAEITEVLGERKYRGRAKVKIGPVLLTFNGEAKFVAVDDAAQTAEVVARGDDDKGRGSAATTAHFTLAPDPAGARVTVSFPKIPSGLDSRARAESSHHEMRCLRSFMLLGWL